VPRGLVAERLPSLRRRQADELRRLEGSSDVGSATGAASLVSSPAYPICVALNSPNVRRRQAGDLRRPSRRANWRRAQGAKPSLQSSAEKFVRRQGRPILASSSKRPSCAGEELADNPSVDRPAQLRVRGQAGDLRIVQAADLRAVEARGRLVGAQRRHLRCRQRAEPGSGVKLAGRRSCSSPRSAVVVRPFTCVRSSASRPWSSRARRSLGSPTGCRSVFELKASI